MRVLIVTKIFPNAAEPLSAPFNRQQFAALGRRCEVEVLATIPWFPGASLFRHWSAAGRVAAVPRREIIDGLPVVHPRFVYLPRVGVGTQAALYTASVAAEALMRRGRVDVLLGSWAYPDGVAAIALGRLLGVPVVVKVHGSDLNVIAKMPGAARQLRRSLPKAHRVVAVSRPLADAVADLGVPRERIDVVSNGVDADLFHPADRAAARAELGHAGAGDEKWILYVGRLERPKGVLDLLDGFGRLAARRTGVRLVLVGDGSARAACAEAAERLPGRVLVLGARPLAEVPRWMAACDLLTLPSWNEGTPNVVLEALACGRRVVATRVGGIPDAVPDAALGELVPARDPAALADALERAAFAPYDADEVARTGARGSWAESAARLEASLRAAVVG